jgi:hypothetical protein
MLKVVPAGGLTKPTDAKSVLDALNPFKTNPLPSWFEVLNWYTLAGGEVILCPKIIVGRKNNMKIRSLIS